MAGSKSLISSLVINFYTYELRPKCFPSHMLYNELLSFQVDPFLSKKKKLILDILKQK